MAASDEDAAVQKLYDYSDHLTQSKDEADYAGIIKAVSSGGMKVKQLAAGLIPRYFKHFPQLHGEAINAQLDLCEEDELKIRVQAIRGLPLLCKDTPQHLSKVTDVLAQLLVGEDNLEQEAVKQALMSVLRQDSKASLGTLFKHIQQGDPATRNEETREKVLQFFREKVFPARGELLKPQADMERYIADLIKQSMANVSSGDLEMFLGFLEKLSLFGDKAEPAQLQELLQMVEAHVHLNDALEPADLGDRLGKVEACLKHCLPFFEKGASNSHFLSFYSKNVLPSFSKLSTEQQLTTLKNLAEMAKTASAHDARLILPQVLELFKETVPRNKNVEDEEKMLFSEAILIAFHNFANKAPNATNPLCGYKFVTGQTSDRLGEDFSQAAADFQERLGLLEVAAKALLGKSTLAMTGKQSEAAKDENATQEQALKRTRALRMVRCCNNVVMLVKPLKSGKASPAGSLQPKFESASRLGFQPSWREPAPKTTAGAGGPAADKSKRPGSGPSSGAAGEAKKRKVGDTVPSSMGQIVGKALQGIQPAKGGYSGNGRGRGGARSGRGSARGGRVYRW